MEVKQPLSVSMTPKLPAQKPAAPQIKPGRQVMKVKGKKLQLKKPGAVPPPAAAPPLAKVSNNPAEVEALGFNSFINKEYDKALEYYEQVLAIDPNFPGAAAQRDKCLEALGQK